MPPSHNSLRICRSRWKLWRTHRGTNYHTSYSQCSGCPSGYNLFYLQILNVLIKRLCHYKCRITLVACKANLSVTCSPAGYPCGTEHTKLIVLFQFLFAGDRSCVTIVSIWSKWRTDDPTDPENFWSWWWLHKHIQGYKWQDCTEFFGSWNTHRRMISHFTKYRQHNNFYFHNQQTNQAIYQ